ncbi:hypothetical protein J2S13_003345 [Oikeobacillus pervagus]|uniref:Uncharacterized protein n=1 Tax=Oikeobacillus pervagus TaxID=1325931 RepID=A0AAJ1T4Y7_9BACI|nr:hypothetical protein [Oikeobacillus pervagus]MDQ0216847.1 hypothetical protein [Oikeobacillus pervagus]
MDICIDLDKNDSFYYALRNFPINFDYDTNLSEKLQKITIMFYKLYQVTKSEVQSIFTINEAKFIVSVLLLNREEEVEKYQPTVYSKMQDACTEKDADVAFDVDMDGLLEKIDNLSEGQALTLAMMVNEIQKEVLLISMNELAEMVQHLFKPVK